MIPRQRVGNTLVEVAQDADGTVRAWVMGEPLPNPVAFLRTMAQGEARRAAWRLARMA